MTDQHLEDRLRDWFRPLHDEAVPPTLRASVAALPDRRPAAHWRDRFRTRPVLVLAAFTLASAAVGGLFVAGGSPAPAPSVPGPTPSGLEPSTMSGISRNGRIAFSSVGRLFVVEPDGTGRQALPADGLFDYAPHWSPDGTRIAFLAQPCTPPSDCPGKETATSLVVMNADASVRRTVAANLLNPLTLAWSPNGMRILFDTYRPSDQGFQLTVVSLDGSAAVPVANGQDASWSPDGRTIAYEGTGGIRLIDTGGTGDRLVVGATAQVHPSGPVRWSPDGSHVAYVMSSWGMPTTSEPWLLDLIRGSQQRMSEVPTGATFMGWSPDGRSIAYVTRQGTGTSAVSHLVLATADGSDPRSLSAPWDFVGWSPDGGRLLELLNTANADPFADPQANALAIIDPLDGGSQVEITTVDLYGASWQPLP